MADSKEIKRVLLGPLLDNNRLPSGTGCVSALAVTANWKLRTGYDHRGNPGDGILPACLSR